MTITEPQNTAIVILAAGGSRRFSGCKVLTPVSGKPMLQWSIEKARACVGEHLYIVTGGWQNQIADAMACGTIDRVATIANRNWQQGLGHSIASAATHLADRYHNLLLLAADQIAITRTDLEAIMQGADGRHIVAAYYAGKPGIPALFPKRCFTDLSRLSGDQGARRLLLAQPDTVRHIDCPNAAIDIDTRDDLNAWLNCH